MASDGVRRGYDVEQLSALRDICDVPLVASGGAGEPGHFRSAFEDARVDATLAANVFHNAPSSSGISNASSDWGIELWP